MAQNPRHESILKIISRLRQVTVQELTERTGVSEVTIRKDLTLLEEMGLLVRTHGGAQLAEDFQLTSDLDSRRVENVQEKMKIAEIASRLISEGDTIYLDSGSTCAALANLLLKMNLRVVTNSITVMNVLVNAPGIALFSIGGSYRREAGSFLGPLAVENAAGFQIETCFIGATAISDRGVFSSQNILESQLKSEILRRSSRRVVLADTSKFNTRAFSVFARVGDVDIVVVDHDFDGTDRLRSLGIEVLVSYPEQDGNTEEE
jgi:DeoR/GlpR family transcriptional regulator of sugar metabolism